MCLIFNPTCCSAKQQQRRSGCYSSDHRLVHPDVPAQTCRVRPEPSHLAAERQGWQAAPQAPALVHGGLPELQTHAAAGKEHPGAAGLAEPGPRGPGAGGEHPAGPAVRSGAHGGGRSLSVLHRAGSNKADR